MFRIPPEFQSTISVFSALFSRPVWRKAQLLLWAAICCPGSRTICNLLRCCGLSQNKTFHKYHRFLSRDKWSALDASKILLSMLIKTFCDDVTSLVFGIDETIERRWGRLITKRAIYRDARRSSASHFVKCSGLRWMSVMLLTPLPWLRHCCWALPILTALCPSQRYWDERDFPRTHKELMTWAGQILGWLARYTAHLNRRIYLVGDGSYATYELLGKAIRHNIGLITRMRLDSRLFHFPPSPVKGKRGPKPKIGKRILDMTSRLTDGRIKWTEVTFSEWYGAKEKKMLVTSGDAIWSRNAHQKVTLRWVLIKDPTGELDPVLLSCTDLTTKPVDIVRYFVRRWRVEVTFAEVRRHLGVETQRQWSDLAIERSTPILMALKSIVCLLAKPMWDQGKIATLATAWYEKKQFTFSDILAAVRQQLWGVDKYSTSTKYDDVEYLKSRIAHLQQVLIQVAA